MRRIGGVVGVGEELAADDAAARGARRMSPTSVLPLADRRWPSSEYERACPPTARARADRVAGPAGVAHALGRASRRGRSTARPAATSCRSCAARCGGAASRPAPAAPRDPRWAPCPPVLRAARPAYDSARQCRVSADDDGEPDGEHRDPQRPARRVRGLHRRPLDGVPRPARRGEDRRRRHVAVGARADLGRVRGRARLRDLPIVGDRDHRARRRAAARRGRRGGHRHAHPPAARDPDLPGGRRARGDPRARRAARPAVRVRVAHLRPVRLRPGVPASRTGRSTRRARRSSGAPVSGVELITPDEAARGDPEGRVRGLAAAPGRRDPATRLPLARRRRHPRPGWAPRWKGFIALHRGPSGEPDGYARYRSEEKWVNRLPASTIVVDELHALNDEAATALWRFLAEIDLVDDGDGGGRSPSDRLPWRLVERTGREHQRGRRRDVGPAVRRRPGARRPHLRARGPPRPRGRRPRARLAGPGRARRDARRRHVHADRPLARPHACPIAALGAAYLGGTRLRDVTISTGVDEHTPGALATADALLRTADEPWCSTFF